MQYEFPTRKLNVKRSEGGATGCGLMHRQGGHEVKGKDDNLGNVRPRWWQVNRRNDQMCFSRQELQYQRKGEKEKSIEARQ